MWDDPLDSALVAAPTYLSGDVRAKLAAAERQRPAIPAGRPTSTPCGQWSRSTSAPPRSTPGSAPPGFPPTTWPPLVARSWAVAASPSSTPGSPPRGRPGRRAGSASRGGGHQRPSAQHRHAPARLAARDPRPGLDRRARHPHDPDHLQVPCHLRQPSPDQTPRSGPPGTWFQHHTRKAWGPERAAAVVAAAETTLALWGNDGLDFEALAADIGAEATIALAVCEQIALLDRRIRDLYTEADPDGIVLSAPGVGEILAGQILGRVGDATRFTNLPAARSFSGLVPRRNSSGLTDQAGGLTKRGDACLRAALFQAADRARKVDPQLGARYQRLMCDTGRHHNSATCTIAAVFLTRIVSCLRNDTHYELRDVDGTVITSERGRAIVAERYQNPGEVRAARRSLSKVCGATRRDEQIQKGVADRSEKPLAPTQGWMLTPAEFARQWRTNQPQLS